MKDVKILLGKRIKELRKERNLSQQELAEIINIDQRNLSNIECGLSFPSKFLVDIANALKISLPELFDFEHILKDDETLRKFIINDLDNLSSENLKIIYRLIKSMR